LRKLICPDAHRSVQTAAGTLSARSTEGAEGAEAAEGAGAAEGVEVAEENYGADADSGDRSALRALRRQHPNGRLEGYNQAATTEPPREGKGSHTRPRHDAAEGPGVRGGTVCCPCCSDDQGGPVKEWICR